LRPNIRNWSFVMIDCSRDGAYKPGRGTRAFRVSDLTNAKDYRSCDNGRRLSRSECDRLGVPPTCKCVINEGQLSHYLDPETPIDEIPFGVSHYLMMEGEKRGFNPKKVFVLPGEMDPSLNQKTGPESPPEREPHPLDEGW